MSVMRLCLRLQRIYNWDVVVLGGDVGIGGKGGGYYGCLQVMWIMILKWNFGLCFDFCWRVGK